MHIFSLLQFGGRVGAASGDLVNSEERGFTWNLESVIEMIGSLGIAGIIIISVLTLLSMIAVYILFERYATIKNAGKEDEGFLNSIKSFVDQKNIPEAKKLCQETNNPISRMIEKGVDRIDKPMTDISAAIENQGKLEIYKMENNLANLATIAGAAPMIGFLGTVIGMILAFGEMEHGGVEVSDLSAGIKTAMITTVGGLIVGIIAYISYNYLVSKIEKVIFQLEARTTEFLDHLHHNE